MTCKNDHSYTCGTTLFAYKYGYLLFLIFIKFTLGQHHKQELQAVFKLL